ncbi:Uncharacterized protein TCM_033527 [Theobroma cacao]|uniref:Uncharacterized protein n=1 Tax=Theobroma cacao TaxID=3641 RepID=A0A061FC12_THECC|nr:Uncharacterized protein TCM_033527 [Theobroma cacao]
MIMTWISMYLLTTPIACARSGLVHTMANIRHYEYGTRDIASFSTSVLRDNFENNLI